MLQRFRSGGLSHLTAVSGQNVALILAVATPLIRKLAPGAQVVSTLLIIGWFVLITRSEPSILRAGVMAAIAVIASSRGRRVDPVRVLSMAVIALIMVDPLLSASVGFHLSVGATFGVISIGPLVTSILPSPKVFSVPIGVTLGAQLGVLIPALAVFQRAPLVALPANLLAVPVAGIVMMVGLPVAIIASLFPPLAQIMLPPIELGVWWVDIVARIAQRVEPASPIPGIVASLVVAALVVGVAVSRQLTRLRARHEG
jgi:competence protein ComEC